MIPQAGDLSAYWYDPPERCKSAVSRAGSICWNEFWPANHRWGQDVGEFSICVPWFAVGLLIGSVLGGLFLFLLCGCVGRCAWRSRERGRLVFLALTGDLEPRAGTVEPRRGILLDQRPSPQVFVRERVAPQVEELQVGKKGKVFDPERSDFDLGRARRRKVE
jgi:hypothetical protein